MKVFSLEAVDSQSHQLSPSNNYKCSQSAKERVKGNLSMDHRDCGVVTCILNSSTILSSGWSSTIATISTRTAYMPLVSNKSPITWYVPVIGSKKSGPYTDILSIVALFISST